MENLVVEKVLAGYYEGKLVCCSWPGKHLSILVKAALLPSNRVLIPLTKETIESYEVIAQTKYGKYDTAYKIDIHFKNGERSLIEVKDWCYRKLLASMY